MSTGDTYVAAAYLVLLVLLLLYVAIISAKLARLDRELRELAELARRRGGQAEPGAAGGVPAREPERVAPKAAR